MHGWRGRHPQYAAPEGPGSYPPIPADPARYLDALRLRTAYIDIRGLQVGTGKAHRFPIEELYMVVGDPGSGKSTFLQRVAHALAESTLGVVPDATQGRLGFPDTPFPILVRLVDVAEHIDRTRTNRSPGQPPRPSPPPGFAITSRLWPRLRIGGLRRSSSATS